MDPKSAGSLKSKNVAGIILAAGEGKRIGRNKALLEIGGVRYLEIVTTCMCDAGCDPVIVVGGADGDRVREEAVRLGIQFALNSNWQNGQFSSLKSGMSALPRAEGSKMIGGRGAETVDERGAGTQIAGALVALVDHPFVKKETYRILVGTFRRFPGRIVIPTHQDRRGHPVVIPGEVITEILDSPDGMTLRDVMRKRDNLVLEQAVDDTGVLKDIDTETDQDGARQS